MNIDAQEFGEMKATVDHLSKSVEKLETAVDKLTDVISELQGGKKIIFAIATGIAGVAGALGWLASNIRLK